MHDSVQRGVDTNINRLKCASALIVFILFLSIAQSFLIIPQVDAATGDPAQTLVQSSYRPWHHWARSTFRAEGRWFVGLYLSSNMYYTHSIDRITWASPILLGTAEASYDCGWWYNGTHVAYVRIPTANDKIYFRLGVPQSDGTIVWSAAEQTVASGSANDFYMASIAIDNQGYAWITCNYSPGVGGGTPRVWRNSNRDGTWSNTAGFPYQLSATNNEVRTVIVPLSTNTVLVFWGSINDNETGLYSRRWDGSAWDATLTVASDLTYTFQAVSIEASDNAWVVWGAFDNGVYHRISARKWNSVSDNWNAKVDILDPFQFGTNVGIAYETLTSDFRVFYQDEDTTKDFFEIRYSNTLGTWGGSTLWYDDSLSWSAITIDFSPFRHDYGGQFGFSHRHWSSPNTNTYFIAEAFDPLSWFSGYLALAVNSTLIDEDLTDFPVLVYLNSSTVDWSNIQNDLDDSRFVASDNTTFLDYELDYYVTNDEAWFYVRLPVVSSTTDTLFYYYFGNTTVSSGENAEAVWDTSEYFAVYHMTDNTTSTTLDSTSYDNDGVKLAAGEPAVASSPLGQAQLFDGSDDYINCSSASNNYTEMSGIVVLNAPAYDQERYAAYQDFVNGGGSGGGWSLLIDKSANPAVLDSINPQLINSDGDQEEEFVKRTFDAWSIVSWDWNGTYLNYFRLGEPYGTPDSIAGYIDPADDLWLGAAYAGGDGNYTGSIDELFVSSITHSDAWHKAMYYNLLGGGKSQSGVGLIFGLAPQVGNGSILDMDYGNWVFTNDRYYTWTATYSDNDGYADIEVAKIAFTDGFTWVNASYDASASTWTLDSGTGHVYLATGTATGSGTSLNVTFPMYLTNDIVDAFDVDLYLYVEDDGGLSDGWTLTDADYFNIYNLGELTEDITTGDGYRVSGGSPFDLAVQNGTAGSSARVNLYVINFQHLNTFVHLWQGASWNATSDYWDCITEHNQTGYLEYGVDYYLDDAWVEGWKVRLEVLNGSAGTFGAGNDEAYVIMNASWYNRGSVVKSDTFVVMYEAYTEQDVTTQFTLWVDLWMSDLEGSRMVAGHVSANYYGMTETGWWLWADWGPIYGTLTSTTFMDYLQDGDDEVIQASSLYMFRVWTQLTKTAEGGGPTDCDNHWWTSNHEVGPNIRTLLPSLNLTGIMTPTLQPTATPDMPIGYFPSLANSLIEVLLRIEAALLSGSTYIYSMATDTIDSLFEGTLGVEDFTATISGLVTTFASNLADSVTYATSLITTIFTLFTGIAAFIIDWLGRVVTVILQIAGIVQSILDGTQTGIGALTNVWDLIDLEDWIDAVPLFMVLGWFVSIDNRGKRAGNWVGVFWGDVNMIMAVFSFIFDMSLRVINLILDWAARFATILFPL